jgi:polyhydroxyalkanoate synthase
VTDQETHTKDRRNEGTGGPRTRSTSPAGPFSISPFSLWEGMFKLATGSVAAVANAQRASIEAAMHSLELMTNSYARLWGRPPEEVLPADKRFRDEAWRENLAFDLIKQAYLITAHWMVDVADGLQDVDPDLHQRAVFYTQQFADAMSPSNFALTNPEVIQETVRTGGANLVQGMQNLMADLQQGRISQVPADAFEVGKDLACTPGKVVYRNKLVELIQYTPTTEQVRALPILVIPPWINKYYVMDLSPHNSMFKYLVDSGFTVFTISWKNPDSSLRDLEWEDYMSLGPLEGLRVVKSITGAEQVNMVGYCLGGIMLQVTLAYMAAMSDETAAGLPSVNSATYFATHQDFGDVGDVAVFISDPEIRFLDWLMSLSGGYLDGRNMAATFNMLRANDLLWHYVINNYLLGKEPPEFDLLYWNSDGTRVPQTVHMYLLRNFFLVNNLAKPGHLKMKGVPIDVGRITTPTYTVAAIDDHIVPWRGAFKMRDMISGPMRLVLAESGHIAGIINHPARNKRGYWVNPEIGHEKSDREIDPDAWFEGATHHKGSWWVDWIPWLEKRSGQFIPPPPLGNEEFRPLMDAPGTYVLEQ